MYYIEPQGHGATLEPIYSGTNLMLDWRYIEPYEICTTLNHKDTALRLNQNEVRLRSTTSQ